MKCFLCVFSYIFASSALALSPTAPKKVYILPPGGYEDEKLFDLSDELFNRDNCVKHFDDLRLAFARLGYTLKTARVTDDLSDGEYILTSGIHPHIVDRLKRYPKNKLIAHIWEPTSVELCSYDRRLHEIYSKIFVMDDNLVDGKQYVKLFYPHPEISMINGIVSFEKKGFCTLISSNKTSTYQHELYSEREKAILWFENYNGGFEFYGHGWNAKGYKNYRGTVLRKVDTLKNYKFCICFENTDNMNGYVTEKIFDCFHAGCVPVYLGAPNVGTFIPDDCFIDFRFFGGDYAKLVTYLEQMSSGIYTGYLVRIRKFLSSSAAYKFSIPYFIHSTIKRLVSHYAPEMIFSGDELRRVQRTIKEK